MKDIKIGFISDTHGNVIWAQKALDILKDCDKILHLGDVLAPGPNNEIIEGYQPKKLAKLLRELDNIYFVKGNCDADVDIMLTRKDINRPDDILNWGDLKIYATHGYIGRKADRIDKAKSHEAKVLAFGHTHMSQLEKIEDIILLNPGSTTYPHDNIHSVGIYENGTFKIINIETLEVIKELIRYENVC